MNKARLEWQLARANVGFLQVLGISVHHKEQASMEELANTRLELRCTCLALLKHFTLAAGRCRLLAALGPARRRAFEDGMESRSSAKHFFTLRDERLLIGLGATSRSTTRAKVPFRPC
jgi:hypothetical protein